MTAELDWRPVWVSLQVGTAATLLALVLGTLIGYALARARFPGARLVEALVLLPLVLPPTVLGYYLLVLIGQQSPIGAAWRALTGGPLVFTINAAIIAATVATVPIVARQMSAAFAAIDPEIIEAARLDGASSWRILLHIQVPLLEGPLAAGAAIAFARAIGDFGTTLMVAGSLPGRTQTASIAIYDLINAGRDSHALLLAILVSIVSLAVIMLTSRRVRW